MTFLAAFFTLVTLLIALPTYALAQGAAETPAEPKFAYCAEPNEMVLELRYSGGMIQDPDATPFVRITCQGKVLIHWPRYTKMAGDYTLTLSKKELESLLAIFAQEQLLTINNANIQAMAARVQAEGPSEISEDHGVTTTVDMRFERVAPADPTGTPLINIDRQMSLPAAAVAASARAPIAPLQNLAAGIREIEALAERPDLVKLPSDNE